MKLSAICILGILGVISLLVSDNPVEGDTIGIIGCKQGQKKGDTYQYGPGCYKCECHGDLTECSGCPAVIVGEGEMTVPGDDSKPYPECCPDVVTDPDYLDFLSVFCGAMLEMGDIEDPFYLENCEDK